MSEDMNQELNQELNQETYETNENTVLNEPNEQYMYEQPAAPEAAVKEFGLAEQIMSILIYPLCFIYVEVSFRELMPKRVLFGIFVLLFLIMGEIFYRERKRTFESVAMMVFTILGAVSVSFSIGTVWAESVKIFFTHLFGVYWVLCRSGRLAMGETSRLLPWDGITGFFVMPFKNWPLNVRAIVSLFRGRKNKKGGKTGLIVLLASVIGIILFIIAMSYLRNADEGFDKIMSTIASVIKIDIDFVLIPKLFMTVFFAMWLYGLFGGCYIETEEQVSTRGSLILKFVDKLRKVPGIVWIIFIALFSVFYILFFALQGHYLFNAFVMKLPQEFTYSQYARKGFGDMCGVMVINFILLWLATRTSIANNKEIKIACTFLNLESMFLALIAFLKITMYIDAYGFTPLRLQSIWAVTVLFFACICFMINLLSNKKTLRVWFYISAASLAVLCMI